MYCMSHCRFSRLLLALDAVGFLATRVALGGLREAIKMTINSGGHKPALHFANGGERAKAAAQRGALGSRACVCIGEEEERSVG